MDSIQDDAVIPMDIAAIAIRKLTESFLASNPTSLSTL